MLAEKLSTKEKLDEKLLLQEMVLGDYQAFSKLYESHVQPLTNYAFNFTRDLHIIEDSIHDVFVSLWNNRSRLQINWSVKAYLFKCVRTAIIARIKKSKKLLLDNDFERVYECHQAFECVKIHSETEFKIKGKISQVLDSLSSKQREVVYLRFYHDLSFEEIAANMNVSTKACYKLMGRAIAELRKTCCRSWQVELIFFLFFLRSMG